MAIATYNDLGDDNLSFARFKAYQDLSHKDVSELFGVDIPTSRTWADGSPTDDATRIAKIAHAIANRARTEGPTSSELQYRDKHIETLNAQLCTAQADISALKLVNTQLKRSPINRIADYLRKWRNQKSNTPINNPAAMAHVIDQAQRSLENLLTSILSAVDRHGNACGFSARQDYLIDDFNDYARAVQDEYKSIFSARGA